MTLFRACLDLHAGQVEHHHSPPSSLLTISHPILPQVKQIVGGSLDLRPANDEVARRALESWPGQIQVGGGINLENAQQWINAGASKVYLPKSKPSPPQIRAALAAREILETGRAVGMDSAVEGILRLLHLIKESLLGFDGRGGPSLMSDFNGLPDSTTSNYHTERFPEAGESSSQLSWDMRTRSSPSRSPSYDPSEPAKYLDMNTSAHLGSSALISSLRTSGGSPSKIVAHGGTREPDKRSLIDIHHLTNHVPRRRLTVEQEQILLRRFAVQEYLSKREMEELAEKLKIPTSQLRTWFGNRRSKLKAAVRQKAKMEAGMGHLTDAELRSLSKRS
ncbi:hypothetical protein PtA15_11A275 [Puccinia triticina]|uniref:Homeobox domain-containing protein n=1 Tax=Puccinia triticina TaxID=208348 RepID=A0ABY7D0P5_9BASI|nr:uncharacterized protein PtA15_11A275 [Puccinia triticina]WAQ89585.1 hypothetical protein PtA15_11A275 [Puccinia triticina]